MAEGADEDISQPFHEANECQSRGSVARRGRIRVVKPAQTCVSLFTSTANTFTPHIEKYSRCLDSAYIVIGSTVMLIKAMFPLCTMDHASFLFKNN